MVHALLVFRDRTVYIQYSKHQELKTTQVRCYVVCAVILLYLEEFHPLLRALALHAWQTRAQTLAGKYMCWFFLYLLVMCVHVVCTHGG